MKSFLQELQRDSNIVTVVAKNDFPYKGRGLQPLIEREYWLRVKRTSLQDPALAGRDDFIILHVDVENVDVVATGIGLMIRPRLIRKDRPLRRSTPATPATAAARSFTSRVRIRAVSSTGSGGKKGGRRSWGKHLV